MNVCMKPVFHNQKSIVMIVLDLVYAEIYQAALFVNVLKDSSLMTLKIIVLV